MIERVPLDAEAHVDLHHALRALSIRGITRVFSEGGPKVAARLIALGLADEVALITAGKPLGRPGVPALSPDARAALLDRSRYAPVETLDYGPDTMRLWRRADGPVRAGWARVRAIRLDFLGPWPLRSRKPPILRVGFPWISLDSLVRIETFQWVTRDYRRKIFRGAFLGSQGARARASH